MVLLPTQRCSQLRLRMSMEGGVMNEEACLIVEILKRYI